MKLPSCGGRWMTLAGAPRTPRVRGGVGMEPTKPTELTDEDIETIRPGVAGTSAGVLDRAEDADETDKADSDEVDTDSEDKADTTDGKDTADGVDTTDSAS